MSVEITLSCFGQKRLINALKCKCHARSQRLQKAYSYLLFYSQLHSKVQFSKNAVQCRTASKHDRLQYKSTAPLATVQQCHVKLQAAGYIPEKKREEK